MIPKAYVKAKHIHNYRKRENCQRKEAEIITHEKVSIPTVSVSEEVESLITTIRDVEENIPSKFQAPNEITRTSTLLEVPKTNQVGNIDPKSKTEKHSKN